MAASNTLTSRSGAAFTVCVDVLAGSHVGDDVIAGDGEQLGKWAKRI